jgi:hypothetical protein
LDQNIKVQTGLCQLPLEFDNAFGKVLDAFSFVHLLSRVLLGVLVPAPRWPRPRRPDHGLLVGEHQFRLGLQFTAIFFFVVIAVKNVINPRQELFNDIAIDIPNCFLFEVFLEET